jgi:hypothetical protein
MLGQNMHGGSEQVAASWAASDAPSARRAHNGVGGRRMAVARMCITGLSYIAARLCAAQELKTLMHIGATIDSVGFGQCPAPS